MNFETSGGLDLYYELSGDGVPSVFLHGGPGYWSKSFQYYVAEYFNEKLKMVYLDQRGCGRSDHSTSKNYSLDRLINDLEELRLHLGWEEWLIMGHSFGGILAVNYANRFPNQTKGLILSNVTLHMFDSFQEQMKKGSELLQVEMKELPVNNLNVFMDSYYSILHQLMEKEKYFELQYVDIKKKKQVDAIDQDGLNTDPNFQRYVFSSEEYFQDFTTLTSKLSLPVQIIAGAHDYAIGPNHHLTFQFNQPEIQRMESGHHPYVENKLEFINNVLNFVDKKFGK